MVSLQSPGLHVGFRRERAGKELPHGDVGLRQSRLAKRLRGCVLSRVSSLTVSSGYQSQKLWLNGARSRGLSVVQWHPGFPFYFAGLLTKCGQLRAAH